MNMNTTSATPPQPRPEDQWSAAGTIGLILVRIVVPLWVLSGALFKIAERSPKLLPKNFIQQMEGMGFDLYLVLALLIAIEFIAVAVMLLIPKLARAAAVDGAWVVAAAVPPPWLMLIIDFILLLGVVCFKPRPLQLTSPRKGWIIATGCMLITSGLAFGLVLSEAGSGGVIAIEPKTDPASSTAQNGDATAPTTTASLPSYYVLDTSDWVGKNIQDIDLVQYITNLPDSINEGQQYLIFYSRTCDHCQMLLELYFGYGSPVPTTLVAIPESKSGFATEGLLDNPCLDCATLELPVGTDWLMTPPILLAIEDGIVQCAKEGEDSEMPECMPW